MKITYLFFALIFLIIPLSIQALDIEIPENHEVRLEYKDLIFGPTFEIDRFPDTYAVQKYETHNVLVLSQVDADSTYLLFINEKKFSYSVISPGTYIIKRDHKSGDFIQAKVFLKNREDTFMRIFPDGTKAKMDVYLLGYKVYEAVPVPIDFYDTLLQPAGKLIELTQHLIDWDLILHKGDQFMYRDIEYMISAIRGELPYLRDAEDGAMNADGRLVYIDSLELMSDGGFNCSGFVKWIVDGLLKVKTGRLLEIEPLKEKHYDYRGTSLAEKYEDERDPYFGLDWTRNLAMASAGRYDNPEEFDVRKVSFVTYGEDVGFLADKIDLVLYQLAVKEPGFFYLGAVNGERGTDPVMRQYYHTVAFFPYFNSAGEFRVAVMTRNTEITIAQVMEIYAGEFIHLVRIQGSDDLELPDQNQGVRLFR